MAGVKLCRSVGFNVLTHANPKIEEAWVKTVGLAAIQIAKKVAVVSVALTRGQSKRQALLDAGATHVIASDEQDLVKEVLRITGGEGARVVFDPVGGPTFTSLLRPRPIWEFCSFMVH